MHKKILICIVLAMFLMPTKAYANLENYLIHHHDISIFVDDVEEAFSQINSLAGFNSSSSINVRHGHGFANRTVEAQYVSGVLETLGDIGEITRSVGSSRNVFAEISELQSELAVREAEYQRIMYLMSHATTIADMTTIERRLRTVLSNMETLTGRINNLNSQIQHAVVVINVSGTPIPVEIEREGFFSQVGPAFVSSYYLTVNGLQILLVFLSYVAVPSIVIGAAGYASFKIKKKLKPRKIEVKEEGEENEKETE